MIKNKMLLFNYKKSIDNSNKFRINTIESIKQFTVKESPTPLSKLNSPLIEVPVEVPVEAPIEVPVVEVPVVEVPVVEVPIANQVTTHENSIHYKTCKEEFRFFCSQYIKYIRNIELSKIKKKSNYEAVLIEFRILPHLEFLIRNTIIKLDSSWSHTIVCGNLNYNYMVELCKLISPNINVIKLNHDNLSQSTYSILLASIKFWKLFHGSKILIYQEDSIIFKNNINQFLLWDYIGAPWPLNQNDVPILVGNGGLSLRSKDVMLYVIKKQNINTITVNSSTQQFMNSAQLTVCPEDVYFSKTIQEYKLGIVADWNTASNFSTESILNTNSFGGHNFWLCDPNWKERIYKNNIIQFIIPPKVDEAFNEHRGGWETIKNSLKKNELYNTNSKYLFYDMLDIQFLFNKGTIINEKWCGILHCTPITPHYLNFINMSNIFNNENFIISLKNCLGIITLSPYLSNYFKNKFKQLNIKINVYTLKHPTITNNIPQFNYINFVNSNNKKIIQLGQQLRKVSSIYLLPHIPNYSKIWLTGTKQFNKLKQFLTHETSMYNINPQLINLTQIPMLYLTNYDDYDRLLTTNIVFMDLYDAAANNAIVECIIRNTPIIVNKIPGVVDYLGDKYPLYYNNLEEVPKLLTEENIFTAHQYLLNMNKTELEIEYFSKKLISLLYILFSNN